MNIFQLDFTSIALALVIALAGMVFHWVKKWTRGEIADGLFEYLFEQEVRATINTLLAVFGSVTTSVAMGGIDPNILEGAIMIFMSGYMGDSIMNKPGTNKIAFTKKLG